MPPARHIQDGHVVEASKLSSHSSPPRADPAKHDQAVPDRLHGMTGPCTRPLAAYQAMLILLPEEVPDVGGRVEHPHGVVEAFLPILHPPASKHEDARVVHGHAVPRPSRRAHLSVDPDLLPVGLCKIEGPQVRQVVPLPFCLVVPPEDVDLTSVLQHRVLGPSHRQADFSRGDDLGPDAKEQIQSPQVVLVVGGKVSRAATEQEDLGPVEQCSGIRTTLRSLSLGFESLALPAQRIQREGVV
mmetsp:Transcript_17781/g.40244  ORF Transcript_17781/g.40244 Transcript_17781/m.40244 type:complete len:243 (+) Transcript_17781:3285-4013(+)